MTLEPFSPCLLLGVFKWLHYQRREGFPTTFPKTLSLKKDVRVHSGVGFNWIFLTTIMVYCFCPQGAGDWVFTVLFCHLQILRSFLQQTKWTDSAFIQVGMPDIEPRRSPVPSYPAWGPVINSCQNKALGARSKPILNEEGLIVFGAHLMIWLLCPPDVHNYGKASHSGDR